jgi:hypothetical protein
MRGARVETLSLIADECSQSERRAADAERELVEWKKVKFMAERVGQRLVVAEPAPVVRRVMDAINFARLVPVFSRTSLAIAELTSGSGGSSGEERPG